MSPSRTTPFAKRTLRDAFDIYIQDQAVRLAARSIRSEREHSGHLLAKFGDKPVCRITVDDVREYLRERKAANAANRTINLETGLLRRIIVRAGRLHVFAGSDALKPLREQKDVGRALSDAERLRLIEVAKSRPSWENAYLAAVLSLNTAMRPGEIQRLRWKDIDFLDKSLIVRRAKTDAGERVIPLNNDAYSAILRLRERSRAIGATEPEHYLFPASATRSMTPDPTKPMQGWRSAWCAMRKAAGLASFRFYDLRHTAITNLAESQTSDTTILDIAGHVSVRMLRHYSHVRKETKRKALDALASVSTVKVEGMSVHVTNHVTNEEDAEPTLSQVVD